MFSKRVILIFQTRALNEFWGGQKGKEGEVNNSIMIFFSL
jgi:hypothetical protein